MSRTQRPKPFVGRSACSDARADRKRASQTLEDCYNAMSSLACVNRGMYPPTEGYEDDPFEQEARVVTARINAIEDRCLSLMERAISEIERDSGSNHVRRPANPNPAAPTKPVGLPEVDPE